MVQAETLETILGVPRSNSGFYPEPDSRAGKEVGNKPGNIPDSLRGKSVSQQTTFPLPGRARLCLLLVPCTFLNFVSHYREYLLHVGKILS